MKIYSLLFLMMLGHIHGSQANAIYSTHDQSIHFQTVQGHGFWLAYDLESFTHFFEQFEVTKEKEDIEDDNHLQYDHGGILQPLPLLTDYSIKIPPLKPFDNFKFGANPFPLFIIYHSWKFHI